MRRGSFIAGGCTSLARGCAVLAAFGGDGWMWVVERVVVRSSFWSELSGVNVTLAEE